MGPYGKLMEVLAKHLPDRPDVWKEILLIVDEIDTEARRDIVRYAREHGEMK